MTALTDLYRWESVIEATKQLASGMDGNVRRDELEKLLRGPGLGLTDSMIDFLLRDQPAGSTLLTS